MAKAGTQDRTAEAVTRAAAGPAGRALSGRPAGRPGAWWPSW